MEQLLIYASAPKPKGNLLTEPKPGIRLPASEGARDGSGLILEISPTPEGELTIEDEAKNKKSN